MIVKKPFLSQITAKDLIRKRKKNKSAPSLQTLWDTDSSSYHSLYLHGGVWRQRPENSSRQFHKPCLFNESDLLSI